MLQFGCETMKTQRVGTVVAHVSYTCMSGVRAKNQQQGNLVTGKAVNQRRSAPRARILWLLAAIAVIWVVADRFESRERQSGTPASLAAQSPSLAPNAGPPPTPAAPVDTMSSGSLAGQFVLVGTMAAGDPLAGAAFIGQSEQTVGLHKANTEIVPGVWLREVYATRVVIERNGVREELSVSSLHQTRNAPPIETAAAAPLPPSGVSDSVRGAPTAATDELQGIHVFPGRNRGAFAQLGLHPGDLITAIDGVPVAGQANTDVMSLLQTGADSTVTVFRAGRLQQITVHGHSAAGP